jgi:protein-S-isoprenylcysteine O-methyltransferase Ste14
MPTVTAGKKCCMHNGKKQVGTTMSRWGVGPVFTALSLLYGVIILILHLVYLQSLTFTIGDRSINLIIGGVLIAIGLPVFIIPALTIDKYFFSNRLCTTGVYGFIRHPIYGAWITFIIPGTVIVMGSVIGITVPVFMYVVYRRLIKKEEQYLEVKFGAQYREYKKRVGGVFPKII